jgi:threonyl-tRNA synthetase
MYATGSLSVCLGSHTKADVSLQVAVVGSKEVEDGTLSLRGRHGVQLGSGSVAEVVRALQVVAEKRELELSVESLRLNQQ